MALGELTVIDKLEAGSGTTPRFYAPDANRRTWTSFSWVPMRANF
jgi:hypothetical protein